MWIPQKTIVRHAYTTYEQHLFENLESPLDIPCRATSCMYTPRVSCKHFMQLLVRIRQRDAPPILLQCRCSHACHFIAVCNCLCSTVAYAAQFRTSRCMIVINIMTVQLV